MNTTTNFIKTTTLSRMYSKCIFVAVLFTLAVADDSKDKHEKYTFLNTVDKNMTVFTFDVSTIKLKITNQNEITYNSLNLTTQSFMSPDKQDGNETMQNYGLTFDNNFLSFTFLGGDHSYNLSMVELSTSNGNTSKSPQYFSAEYPNLKLTKNVFKRESQGYKCGNLKLTLDLNGEDTNTTAEIVLTDISFLAFQNSIKADKPSFLECRQEPGNSVIPLAVGGGLLVFMGIALVVYIFMRSRSS